MELARLDMAARPEGPLRCRRALRKLHYLARGATINRGEKKTPKKTGPVRRDAFHSTCRLWQVLQCNMPHQEDQHQA